MVHWRSRMLISKKLFNSPIKKIAIVAVGIMLSLSANAYDADDKVNIEQKIEIIHTSAKSLDFEPLINMMPEKVLQYMALKANIPPASLKQIMITMSSSLIDPDTDIEYVADLDSAKVFTSKVGRDYLIIPTQFKMITDNEINQLTGNLLAFEDEGAWYLMRVEGQNHLDIIAEIYPDLTDLELFETSSRNFSRE